MNKLFIIFITLALSMLITGCNATDDGGTQSSSLEIDGSNNGSSDGSLDGLGGLPIGTMMGDNSENGGYSTESGNSTSTDAEQSAGESEQSAGETKEESEDEENRDDKDEDDARSYADDDDDDENANNANSNSAVNINFLRLGDINATADGKPYTLIALKDVDNGLQATGYKAGSITGQILIQIVGYDLNRDNTINLATGSLMLKFEVARDSFAEGSGSYNLIYPQTNGGLINILTVIPENDKYHITGNLEIDVPRKDNPRMTFHLSSQFSVTLLNLEN